MWRTGVAAPQPGSDTAEAVPLAAVAIFTAIPTLVGTGLASELARRLARPAGPFVIVTVALTVLSLALPATADTDTASQVVLGLTHLVAAAVVIPALAMRLRR